MVNTPFGLSLYASSTPTLGNDAVLLGSMNTPADTHLAADGGTSVFRFNFTTPSNAPTGREYLVAVVNANRSMAESTYGNNLFASVQKVTVV